MKFVQKNLLILRGLGQGMLVTVILLCVALVGCGSESHIDPDRASISGKVTFNGEPLKGGTIIFESKEKGISASTFIRSEGRYETSRAPQGPNAVSIDTESLRSRTPDLYIKIPERYADTLTSGLSVDVQPGTNENVDFELTQ